MCIGIPMQVIGIEGSFAWCAGRNGAQRIGTLLVGEVAAGQWLLVFLGMAREIIDAERAARVDAALDALQLIAQGDQDIDHCFADLLGREPQLPEFLRKDPQP
ncbi:MAG: HypC/HybG/HupF family hydrogenase formation chaperone [Pseudomonadota bacterium]|nr:HypC/HybG/HupF family hydrogenase formation chaperone [Pseudomonadota bacterium]